MVEVQLINGKGRGVVATTLILKGTVIEVAPVGSFPAEERPCIDTTEVFTYYFVVPEEYACSKQVSGHIVFGVSSLCNHAENPNAYIKWVKDTVGLWARLVAHTEIQPGEEVTLFYTNIDEYPSAHKFI